MSAENWLDLILKGVGTVNGQPTGVVPVFNADTSLKAAITGTIEAGLINPLPEQVVTAADTQPGSPASGIGSYCSLSIPSYGEDVGAGHQGRPTGTVTLPVAVRAAVVVRGYPQLACESTMRTILGQLAVTVGQNWRANPFGIKSALGLSTEIKVGSAMMEPASQLQSGAFVVFGAYHFTLYYRLQIAPTS